MIDTKLLAAYIICRCEKQKQPVTNLYLQKILYCLQRYWLQSYNKKLFNSEIEAWQFGPCIPAVYYHYCGHGAMEIRWTSSSTNNLPALSAEKIKEINTVIDNLAALEPWKLNETISFDNSAYTRTLAKTKKDSDKPAYLIKHPVISVEMMRNEKTLKEKRKNGKSIIHPHCIRCITTARQY